MSNTPVYVAGLERGVRPIGDWSMSMTLSSCSRPSIPSWSPAIHLALFKNLARCLYSISLVNELFPEPDTPVTQVMIPRGICTSIFFRLFSLAPLIVIYPLGLRLSCGTGIFILPLRYAPVSDFLHFIMSFNEPAATISPPCEPAPGPTSTI